MRLYKGSATAVARSSPYALYDRSLTSFGESGGEFSQAASPGFIELFTLQTRMAHRIRARRRRARSERRRRRMTASIYELIGRLVVRFVRPLPEADPDRRGARIGAAGSGRLRGDDPQPPEG